MALIHLESHFTDENAGPFRAATYRRLRRHWQFINELKLFEIQNQRRYGVNVYGAAREPSFLQAASLYHPATVEASLKHDGSGAEPGIKDLDGRWDLRPHASRIVRVDSGSLESWHATLESESVPVQQTRMVYVVNRATAAVLDKLSKAPRVGELALAFSRGWDESIDRKRGFFDSEWGAPESWDSVILQGSHLGVGRPLFKYPNPTMLHNTDWTEVDLEVLAEDDVPITSYKPRGDPKVFEAAYTQWPDARGASAQPAREHYRLAWRNMAANTGVRTLVCALIPPGTTHIHGVSAVGLPGDPHALVSLASFSISLIHDFVVRVAPKSTISLSTLARLPHANDPIINPMLALRTLRLNALTEVYGDLWAEVFDGRFQDDSWSAINEQPSGRVQLQAVADQWTPAVPLRNAFDRYQALLEVDVLVALSLQIEIDELVAIYETQFPVLFGYDQRRTFFDRAGRLAPAQVASVAPPALTGGASGAHSSTELTENGGLLRPSVRRDRSDDMRLAYAQLEARVRARRENSS